MTLYDADRLQELRQEIEQLKKPNEIYENVRGIAAEADRERRRLRLLEIKAELAGLMKKE